MRRTIGFVPMRALEGSHSVHATAGRRRSRRALPLAALAGALAAAFGALDPAASAHEPSLPEYSLKIVQGETTQPEDSIVGVSAGGPQRSQVRLRVIQGGLVVNQATEEGGAGLWQVVPPVGDTVTVESPLGTVVGAVTYDGLPSIEPTVCAGSTNFSGQRSGADEVEGGFYIDEPQTDPYGHVYNYEHGHRGYAQVTLLAGVSFGGNFLVPLQLGETVWATETVKVREPGWVFTYQSEAVRPVGSCPLPPPPPPPPAKPILPPLRASLAKILSATIKALLEHGLKDRVYVNQPGTVTQGLYLAGGKLPAYAASSHHRHLPPALLLAKGAAGVKTAGDVTVVLHLTPRGRGRVRGAKSVHAVLVTTVTSSSGVKITLSHRSVTLHR